MLSFSRISSMTMLVSLVSATGFAAEEAKEPPPYDADLFNRDKTAVFVNAEFLYWQVNEGALDYAVKMNQPAWSAVDATYGIGHYENAQFDWAPGVRASIGYFTGPYFWDFFVQYTYLHATGSDRVSAPSDGSRFLNGTWPQPDFPLSPSAPLSHATSHIKFTYHLPELLFSRRFQPSEHFRLNVFGGLTTAFIYQKWKVSYLDINNQTAAISNRWQFEGLGVRLGIKLDWYTRCCDLYLTGQFSSAILTGWYKNISKETTSAIPALGTGPRTLRDTDFHNHRLPYNVQFLLGPSWQKRFETVRVELLAGYELTIWNDLHEVYRTGFDLATAAKETYINNSNLSLQGLTVRLTVDF